MLRRETSDRYRITRAAFDVISVFPSLSALAIPGPVFSAALRVHGYKESAVKNRLVRMVQQGQLSSERVGRTSLYRVHPTLREKLDALRNRVDVPSFDGQFHAVMHAIPESRRPLRDRLTYVANYFDYRPLRPGVLIGFADNSARLTHMVGDVADALDDAWFSFGSLHPHTREVAESWVRRAFVSADVPAKITDLESRARGLIAETEDGGLAQYMDLLYEALWMFNQVSALPAEFAHLSDDDVRLYRVLAQLNGFYWEHCAAEIVDRALEVPAAGLIEYEETGAGTTARAGRTTAQART